MCLVGIAIAWWLLVKKSLQITQQALATNSSPVATQQPVTNNGIRTQLSTALPRNAPGTVIVEGVTIPEAVVRYMQNIRADPTYDWKQPINFYGKVVDENGQPVAGASVDYTWSTIQAARGTRSKHDVADSFGIFSIHEIGKRIGITVSKDGYYTTPSEKLKTYEYANPGDGLFTPNPYNPEVFHLRKKGVGVDLITSQFGMSPDFPIHIPRDGTPVKIDFINRKEGENGQMQISENKPGFNDWKQATAWSFKMEIPDGGFVEENDEFPFEAPASGYQSVLNFQFQSGNTNWVQGINKTYYIEFGNPPLYGRIQVQTDISYGGAFLTYAINPDGSRNLEPK